MASLEKKPSSFGAFHPAHSPPDALALARQPLNAERIIEMSNPSETLINKQDLKVALIGIPALFSISGCIAIMIYGIPETKPYMKSTVDFHECKRLEQPLASMEAGIKKDNLQSTIRQCYADAEKNNKDAGRMVMTHSPQTEAKVRAEQFVRIDAASSRGTALQRTLADFTRISTEIVKTRLRDPHSAQFRDIVISTKTLTTCGEVNAKNGFGGYAGFKPFIVSAGSDFSVHMLEGDTQDFMQKWQQHCT